MKRAALVLGIIVLLGGVAFAVWAVDLRYAGQGQCLARNDLCLEPERQARALALKGLGVSVLIAAALIVPYWQERRPRR